MEKNNNFIIISIVAIVAIAGMVLLFTGKTNCISPTGSSDVSEIKSNEGGAAVRVKESSILDYYVSISRKKELLIDDDVKDLYVKLSVDYGLDAANFYLSLADSLDKCSEVRELSKIEDVTYRDIKERIRDCEYPEAKSFLTEIISAEMNADGFVGGDEAIVTTINWNPCACCTTAHRWILCCYCCVVDKLTKLHILI